MLPNELKDLCYDAVITSKGVLCSIHGRDADFDDRSTAPTCVLCHHHPLHNVSKVVRAAYTTRLQSLIDQRRVHWHFDLVLLGDHGDYGRIRQHLPVSKIHDATFTIDLSQPGTGRDWLTGGTLFRRPGPDHPDDVGLDHMLSHQFQSLRSLRVQFVNAPTPDSFPRNPHVKLWRRIKTWSDWRNGFRTEQNRDLPRLLQRGLSNLGRI